MSLLEGIAAGVHHEEAPVVKCQSLRFVSYLHGIGDRESGSVDFSHIASGEGACLAADDTFMGVAGDVDVTAVGGQLAVVGHILGGGDGGAVRADELDDIRPVDGDGQQLGVHLHYVVRRVAELVAVYLAEPFVAHYAAVLEVGDAAVVRLPAAFVEDNDFLLRGGREDCGEEG